MNSLTLSLAGLLVFGVAMPSAAQGRAKAPREQERAGGPVAVLFVPHDVELIRTHYRVQSRDLPPGLQKKLARGGTLPSGWEKKLERFPANLERDLVVLPPGHARGVIDGHAVIYSPATHAILDIVTLF
jgi:hypothetical protein